VRKFFIVYVARELRLIFPTPSATAMTIRSMHQAVTGERMAKLKMKGLSIAFSGALIVRVVSQYATGILWDWHFFTWFYIWGHYKSEPLTLQHICSKLTVLRPSFGRPELGLVPGMDSCLYWFRYACRSQRLDLVLHG
jgi:hypothetical protein